MKIRGNEIIVFRNETWTLSKLVENRDGSPYIISSQLINPYWLITVSPSLYVKPTDTFFNKWLSLKNTKRFLITKPIELKSIDSNYTFDNVDIPAGYEGDETSGYANIAIFSFKNENGVINYKYWEYNNNEANDFTGRWVEYACSIITTFDIDITSKLIEQNYYYRILLVDGVDSFEQLKRIVDSLNLKYDDNLDVYDLYNLAIENAVDLSKFNVDRPISVIDSVYEILEPTKMHVKSNLRGVSI